MNKLYCGDNIKKIIEIKESNLKINGVITSPPYNISRPNTSDCYDTKYVGYDDKVSNEKYNNIFNFIEAPNNNKGEHTLKHKATFSTELCNELIKIYFKKGQTLLDPHMGTGTLGVSCSMNNLNFLGIDLVQEYVDIAEKRIKDYSDNLQMEF